MHSIKKAIIPVAGLATRVYPMNKVTKKALLPICDSDLRIKPVILKLLEELDDCGIEEIYLIIGKEDKEIYENLFKYSTDVILNKLNDEDKKYEDKLYRIGKKISYIIQYEQLGFGHAVYLAKDKIGDEPSILLLGDTIYKSSNEDNCVEQLLSYYDSVRTTIIALKELKEEELKYYGTVQGTWKNNQKTEILLKKIVEKPSIEYARENLTIDNKFFGNFGEFVLTKELFDELEKIINKPILEGKEYQLMDAFDNLIQKNTVHGLVINGNSYDIGNIKAYRDVLRNY